VGKVTHELYKDLSFNYIFPDSLKVPVPVATVDALYELALSPRKLTEAYYDNLLNYTEFPRGGHFTAFEEPELISKDIKSFVRKVLEQRMQEQQKKHDEV